MKKLIVATALVAALALPAGIAVAQDAPVGPEPTCQHDGTGPLHEGPRDGTGLQYRLGEQHQNGAGLGQGHGVQDGTGPIHEAPADGTGMQYGRDAS